MHTLTGKTLFLVALLSHTIYFIQNVCMLFYFNRYMLFSTVPLNPIPLYNSPLAQYFINKALLLEKSSKHLPLKKHM